MIKLYNSTYYNFPIEVEYIESEILVSIKTPLMQKVIYSWYDIKNKTSYSPYINKSLLGSFIKKIPKNVLILGLWAWSYVKFLEDHINDVKITAIEIDKAMIDISINELKIKTPHILCWDAFLVLDELIKNDEKFDAILIDCYWIDSKIPENLMSYEFFNKCKLVLENSWVITVNMANFELEKVQYTQMHQNMKNVFWEFYDFILSWKNDVSNVIWVYNLDKNYTAKEYTTTFINNVESWFIKNNTEILKDTFVWKNIFNN